jgi:hypothetical protein
MSIYLQDINLFFSNYGNYIPSSKTEEEEIAEKYFATDNDALSISIEPDSFVTDIFNIVYRNHTNNWTICKYFGIMIFIILLLTTDFIVCTIGFYHPIYYAYQLLTYPSNNRIQKIKSILKYLIIYAHLEITYSLLLMIYIFPFLSYLRLIWTVLLWYFAGYRQDILNQCYLFVIQFDHQIVSMIKDKDKDKIK